MSRHNILSVRIHPDVRMKLEEAAIKLGTDVSTIVKTGLKRVLDAMFDEDGYLSSLDAMEDRRKLKAESGYYPAESVASIKGISLSLINRWARDKDLPYIKKRGNMYVRLKDIERIIEYGKDKHGKKW